MATQNLREGTAGVALPALSGGKAYKLKKQVDFSVTDAEADDVLQLFDIPAGTFVMAVIAKVTTEEGGTLTFDIGDADDPDGYVDGANGNSAGDTCSAPGTLTAATSFDDPDYVTALTLAPALGGGKYYSANGIVSMIVNNAAATAVIDVEVICI